MAKFPARLPRSRLEKAKISGTEPARPLIWTHRTFFKGFRGEARSRKPGQPGQPGSYEEALNPPCALSHVAGGSFTRSSRKEWRKAANDLPSRVSLRVRSAAPSAKKKFYQATVIPSPPSSYKASQAHSVSVDLLVTDVVLLHTQWIPYLKLLERGMKRQTDPYGKAMKK